MGLLPPGRMLVHAHSMLRDGGLCFLAVRLDRIEVSHTLNAMLTVGI